MTGPRWDLKRSAAPSGTAYLTTAQAIVRFLAAQYTELLDGRVVPLFGGVMTIFGHGNVAGLGEALYDFREKLPTIRGQNEQGMAHAAIAYAKAHRGRRLMAVTTSIGPGATNLLTAAALAHINRLPVLFLPGDVFASRRPDPVLQQLEDERCPLRSVNSAFEGVSRYYDCVTRPEQLLKTLPAAIHTMMAPQTRGPATLALPQDVQTEAYPFPLSFFEPKVHALFRPEPDRRQLDEAIACLREAKTPLIVAGGGVHYSGATEVLQALAERHGIPVAETQAGKGALHWDHPLALGGIGVTGTSAANEAARQADVVLCVGTRLSDFTTASRSLFKGKRVAVNVRGSDAIKMGAIPVEADALRALTAIGENLKDYQTSADYRQDLQEWRTQWFETRRRYTEPSASGLPTDAQVLAAVNEVAGADATVVCAAGGLPGELHKHWNAENGDHYHVEYGYSCMGYEIAGGLGVKMAKPDREVFVLVGDGSYLMLHTELLTARALGIHLQVVVLDNKGFGCIHRLQQAGGAPSFANLLPTPVDFVANAASYGCRSVKVRTCAELKEALRRPMEGAGPCVTVIETDPHRSTPGTAWWDVAISEVSNEAGVREARHAYEERLKEVCS